MLGVTYLTRSTFSRQTYHDVHYVAEKHLVAGEEIFVEYGASVIFV